MFTLEQEFLEVLNVWEDTRETMAHDNAPIQGAELIRRLRADLQEVCNDCSGEEETAACTKIQRELKLLQARMDDEQVGAGTNDVGAFNMARKIFEKHIVSVAA